MGVLPLYPGQLHHHNDEDHQAQNENEKEVGHYTHIEGDVIQQPAAAEGQKR